MSKRNFRNYCYLKGTDGLPLGSKDEIKASVKLVDKDSIDYFLSHNKGHRPLTDEEIEAKAQSQSYSDLEALWLGGKK